MLGGIAVARLTRARARGGLDSVGIMLIMDYVERPRGYPSTYSSP